MSGFKDWLVTASVVIFFLLGLFALDDSYEDSILSAQVLDEAIAHCQVEQSLKYELVAYREEAVKP